MTLRSMLSIALAALLAITPNALLAQNEDLGSAPPTGGEVQTVQTDGSEADEGGLTGSVSFEGSLDDLSIAIPAFAAERDVATAANARGTAALGEELARVITADLQNNGLFAPTGPDALPRPSYPQITDPVWSLWNLRRAEMLVQGLSLIHI